jgi:hypothetical protein
MIDQANQLAEQSPHMTATQQASAAPAEGPDFEPIAGVSLELYAEISKGLAAHNYDQSKAAAVAASKGVTETNWTAAIDGWNVRMRSNPTVGRRFNALYAAV